MAQGKTRAARNLTELQPTAVIELWELHYDNTNTPEAVFKFHAGTNGLENPIVWGGDSYMPLAIETQGFEAAGNQKLPRPKVKISNDHLFITDLLVRYNDLKDAKLIRVKTFLKFIDDVNFDGSTNPFGTADSAATISIENYIVAQKLAENRSFVEFELASPLDLENSSVPNRAINGRYCFWQYRGHGCGYAGLPVHKEDGSHFSIRPTGSFVNATPWQTGVWATGDLCYIENPKITIDTYRSVITNVGEYATDGGQDSTGDVYMVKVPMRVYYVCSQDHSTNSRISGYPPDSPNLWEKDGCAKTLGACKKHFLSGEVAYTGFFTGINNQQKDYLPFGGYPATDQFPS